MSEPVKPFACTIPDCGMTFTNEDHLHVHTKKHDMVLQLGSEQKAAFVADQTPTPTRFIRNCEEVGLFQDLQNVAANPFDEGFKRAMEAKAGILSLESAMAPASDDVLHTPQMVFPSMETGDATLYNAQRNITISRSSSDESGTIKELETRTISKLTNEVTTISRIVNNNDEIKQTDIQKDTETVCYKNNVIRIESNIIRKDIDNTDEPVLVYTDSVIKVTNKSNVIDIDNNKLMPDKLPIMSQKSIDFVVDSLTSELETNSKQHVEKSNDSNVKFVIDKIDDDQLAKIAKVIKENTVKNKKFSPRIMPKAAIKDEVKKDGNALDYEVVIKLPDGKRVLMKPVDETEVPKEIIRNRLTEKISKLPIGKRDKIIVKKVQKPIVTIPTGTLIPVTLVTQAGTPLSNNDLHNVPITKINNVAEISNIKFPASKITNTKRTANNTTPNKVKKPKFTSVELSIRTELKKSTVKDKVKQPSEVINLTEEMIKKRLFEKSKTTENDDDDDCVVVENDSPNPEAAKMQRIELERRSAASKRYRDRLKNTMQKQSEENRQLREANQRLIAEKAVLKLIITEHMKGCPNGGDIGKDKDIQAVRDSRLIM